LFSVVSKTQQTIPRWKWRWIPLDSNDSTSKGIDPTQLIDVAEEALEEDLAEEFVQSKSPLSVFGPKRRH